MADTTRDIWNDNDGEETPKKRSGFRRFLTFFLILVVVLAVVVVAAYRDGTGFDALRRYFHYGAAEKISGDTVYRYDAGTNNRFAALGDHLVVLSGTTLRLLDPAGSEVWSSNVQMTAPALAQGGGRVAAYGVGGRQLYVLDETGEIFSMTADEGEELLSATLNGSGMLTVTAKKPNYKGSVSVYNAEMELIFEFNSSRRFVTDAYTSDDGTCMAAVTLGQEESVFVSNVVIYDLTQTQPKADYSVMDGMVADIGMMDGSIVTVADTCITFADTNGRVKAAYSYEEQYLREYDIAGDDFAVLLLNRYKAGSVGQLVSVGTDGKEISRLDIHEEVLSVSASGRYIAVLYADQLAIYNPQLQLYATLHGTNHAKEVLVRQDGSALLLAAEMAEVYLP